LNVSALIARRYLFSKGNRNVINIISGIAATGVAVGSLAMIIVLSAFNGLETLVGDLYTTVDPDLRVGPTQGKVVPFEKLPMEELETWPEIKAFTPVLEETVFLQYRDQQTVVTLRGIQEDYLKHLELEAFVVEGSHALSVYQLPAALMGYGVADNLNLFVGDANEAIRVYAADRSGLKSANPQNKFVMERIVPSGIVALNPEFDFKYFYTPYAFADTLLQRSGSTSFIDITLLDDSKASDVKKRLLSLSDGSYDVKTRVELNDLIFKTNATEKWVTFFILSFILIVATFNLIGSLTMLIIEKRPDISLLRSIGQSIRDVQFLFLYEGLLITGLGAVLGLGTGVLLILAQQYIGFFPLEGGLVEFYPVELHLLDIVAVLAVVGVIGFVASILPVKVLLNKARLETNHS